MWRCQKTRHLPKGGTCALKWKWFKDSPDTQLLFIILLWTNFTSTYSFPIFQTHTSDCDRCLGNTQVCLSYICLNNVLFKKISIIHWLYIKWQSDNDVTERLFSRSTPSWTILGQEDSIIGCMRWNRQWKKMNSFKCMNIDSQSFLVLLQPALPVSAGW